MKGKIIRSGSVFILVLLLLSSSLIIASESAMAYSWYDEFPGPGLDTRWTTGWIGQASDITNPIHVRPTGGIYVPYYTGMPVGVFSEDWHGPYLRTQVPSLADFNVTAQFRCVAEEEGINRLMVRALGQSKNQLFSFGWGDVLSSDDKSEIGLYGSSFSSPIFKTGASYLYSNFQFKDIGLSRSGQNLSFYANGNLLFSGPCVQTSVAYIDIVFLKYKNQCTIKGILDMKAVSISSLQAESVPGMPTNLASTAGNGYINLKWSPPTYPGSSPVTNYKVYRGTELGAETFLTSTSGATEFNNTGLTNGQKYFYRVSAVNEVGEGTSCAAIDATPTAVPVSPGDPITDPDDPLPSDDPVISVTVPGIPTSLMCVAVTGSITVSWKAPASDGGSAITGYNLYRSTDQSAHLYLLLGVVNAYIDTGLIANQTYHYWVAAVNSVGHGALSLEAVATPGSGTALPSAPRNLAAYSGDGTVRLSWSAPLSSGNLPLLGYRIYRGNSSGSETLMAELGNLQTFADADLTNNVTYFYKVSALNSLGEGPSVNCSAKPQAPPMNTTDIDEDMPVEPTWIDNFTLTSSIVTLIALVIGLGIAYFFLRGNGSNIVKSDEQTRKRKDEKKKAEPKNGKKKKIRRR